MPCSRLNEDDAMLFDKWYITWCVDYEWNLGIRRAFAWPKLTKKASRPNEFSFKIGPFWLRKWR